MSNPGFNIKVRLVENGWTVHLTQVRDGEGHKDFVVDPGSIKTFIGGLVDEEVDLTIEHKQSEG